MSLNLKLTSTILSEALDDKSWKTELPVLDHSKVFKYFSGVPEYLHFLEDGEKYYKETFPLMGEGIDLVEKRYPGIKNCCIAYNSTAFLYRPMSYRESMNPSQAQRKAFFTHIEIMLENSKVFPFPGMLPEDIQFISKVRHGLRMLAYDLYRPMNFQHETKPTNFYDSTAAIMKLCPTIFYDEPHKIFDYYPLEFVVVCPYFTIPKELPWIPFDGKYSLLDLYLPDHLGKSFRFINDELAKYVIDAMYAGNEPVQKVAKTMLRRAKIVVGQADGPTPESLPEFLLKRDRARRHLHPNSMSSNLPLHLNINEAAVEATRRAKAEEASKLLSAANKVIEQAKKIHIEEFGK